MQERQIELEGVSLPAILRLPEDATALVLFAHGSGSSRLSSRNNAVADDLAGSGLASILFDLLTGAESADRRNVFDIGLLADRLAGARLWARDQPDLADLPPAYFGASTGAAAALTAAIDDETITSVVSRGGRPDLTDGPLERVAAPTLLIVGGLDEPVIGMNQSAYVRLGCEKRIEIVEGATHLFEEPGALERVSELTTDWIRAHAGRTSDVS